MSIDKDKIIFGRHPVLEAIRAGAAIEKVMVLQGARGPFEQDLRRACDQAGIPLQYVPKERLNKFTDGNHQGVIARFSEVRYAQLDELLADLESQEVVPLLLILDGVTDVRNLGAIARTAELCGAHALIVPHSGTAQINAEAMKSSAGALAKLPVCREKSLFVAVETLQMANIRVLALTMEADFPIHQIALDRPTALILGSEGRGVHPKMIQIADESCYIPQKGEIDSFNVSVAAGIALYEAMRQRG